MMLSDGDCAGAISDLSDALEELTKVSLLFFVAASIRRDQQACAASSRGVVVRGAAQRRRGAGFDFPP